MMSKGHQETFSVTFLQSSEEKQWYQYHDRAYEKIAREWCEKYGIEIEK